MGELDLFIIILEYLVSSRGAVYNRGPQPAKGSHVSVHATNVLTAISQLCLKDYNLDLMVKDRLVSYVQEMGVSQGGILALVSFSIKLTLTSGTYVSLHARVLKI